MGTLGIYCHSRDADPGGPSRSHDRARPFFPCRPLTDGLSTTSVQDSVAVDFSRSALFRFWSRTARAQLVQSKLQAA